MNSAFAGCTNLVVNAADMPNLSKVTDMSGMFSHATDFNQNISNWDVANVEDMTGMFEDATAFNQNISNWDVSNVEDMTGMFSHATDFNQNIGKWDVANVNNMFSMFSHATAFNQNISNWDVSQVTRMNDMFSSVRLSTSNYDAILKGWAKKSVQNNVVFSAGASQYTASTSVQAARNLLIATYGWRITDGGSVVSK